MMYIYCVVMLGSVELMLIYVSKTKLWLEVEEYVFRICEDMGVVYYMRSSGMG